MTPAPARAEYKGRRGKTGEAGFALIAALVAAVLFAFFAYTVLAADRGAVAGVGAQLQRARMEAAADAGLATVMAGLGQPGSTRWPIDGRSQSLAIDDMNVAAAVEDERGKMPLNRLRQDQVRRLLQAAGASGAQLDHLTDGLLNWNDGGVRPNGATMLQYAADGVRPRAAPAHTVGELAAIAGMDPDLLDRIALSLTVFPDGSGAFEPQTASHLTIVAMSGNTPDSIIQSREQAGERPKLEIDPEASYAGRTLTIRIVVHAPDGGTLHRSAVVEMTGQPNQPVWIRGLD
ncbi:MAG: hypothetical protein WA840_01780 [Caulobacteraceae bacterium]